MNTSTVASDKTARTHYLCARQRAENLAILGATNVLELCVGPSLKVLEEEYKKLNIEVTGNDIEIKWKRYYPSGRWLIGDALALDYGPYDAIVYAPPLSRGCTGRRSDALSIGQVTPAYADFLKAASNYSGIICLVLPGRSFATKLDRKDFYNTFNSLEYNIVPLRVGKVNKYYDLYLERK